MICGIGIDSVDIIRFAHWYTYSREKLLRVFSMEEIDYCLQTPAKSAERFAVRFAAREAFFKALCSAYPHKKFFFIALCKKVSVVAMHNGAPMLVVAPNVIENSSLKPLLTLTHNRSLATAIVVLQ